MYQKLIIIGRLGQDPVMKTVNGESLCKFSVATSNVWTDQSGTKHEDTTWHNVDVWGKSAASCGQYLHKGSLVMVEGEVKITKHEDKTFYGVKAFNVRFLTPKSEGGASSAPPQNQGQASGSSQQMGNMSQPSFTEEDIPF